MADRYFSFDGETYQTHEHAPADIAALLSEVKALRAQVDARHWCLVEALIAAGVDVDLDAIAASKNPWGDVVGLIASLGDER